ncbi:unnamed protein product [Oppiella nova]|uniref:Uncharacterized protein n=1 Tax=Oppiella nova TaxID=334625 RepID=A0A7R9LBQ8_9ACAR|nr:unnamed protein product [Oppiella nova]CAG2161790.1 unnamed protein product [Oppiella nova]
MKRMASKLSMKIVLKMIIYRENGLIFVINNFANMTALNLKDMEEKEKIIFIIKVNGCGDRLEIIYFCFSVLYCIHDKKPELMINKAMTAQELQFRKECRV